MVRGGGIVVKNRGCAHHRRLQIGIAIAIGIGIGIGPRPLVHGSDRWQRLPERRSNAGRKPWRRAQALGRNSIAIAIAIAIPIVIPPDGFTLWVNADRATTTLQRSEESTTSPPTGSREPTIWDKLMACVEQRVADGSVLKLIRQFLRAPVLEEPKDRHPPPRKVWPRTGTPQDGVISPLLANLDLHSRSSLSESTRSSVLGRSTSGKGGAVRPLGLAKK